MISKDEVLQEIKRLKDYIEDEDFDGFYKEFSFYSEKGAPTQMFYDAGILDEILFKMTTIPENMFLETDIPLINIPSNIEIIDKFSCSNCKVKRVNISAGVKKIGAFAFASCTRLESILIPGSVTSIGDRAFSNDESLKSLILEDGIETIGSYAFANCLNLTELIIPKSITDISLEAFSNCESLQKVKIPRKFKTSLGYIFGGVGDRIGNEKINFTFTR